MSLAQIRDEYRVPARLGARVTVNSYSPPRTGTITGCHENFIIIDLDDGRFPTAALPTDLTFHPTTQGA